MRPEYPRNFLRLAVLVLAALGFASGFGGQAALAQAGPGYAVIVVSEAGGVYGQIVQRLQAQASGVLGQYRVVAVGDDEFEASLAAARGIITIGTGAADAVYGHAPPVPVLSALVTESGFNYLADRHYGSIDGALQQGVAVIYLDQPLSRLYLLGKLLVPDATRVGVIGSEASGAEEAAAKLQRALQGVEVESVMLSSRSSPIKHINPLIHRSDFVAVLPGKKSLTLPAAKWVLQIGSTTRTPVIAYSRKYVKSGALAAAYTSPENVADQVAELLEKTQGLRAHRPGILPPAGFSIEVNSFVARTLGIRVPESQWLQAEIRRLEQAP